jgi:hypothetical protein
MDIRQQQYQYSFQNTAAEIQTPWLSYNHNLPWRHASGTYCNKFAAYDSGLHGQFVNMQNMSSLYARCCHVLTLVKLHGDNIEHEMLSP